MSRGTRRRANLTGTVRKGESVRFVRRPSLFGLTQGGGIGTPRNVSLLQENAVTRGWTKKSTSVYERRPGTTPFFSLCLMYHRSNASDAKWGVRRTSGAPGRSNASGCGSIHDPFVGIYGGESQMDNVENNVPIFFFRRENEYGQLFQ